MNQRSWYVVAGLALAACSSGGAAAGGRVDPAASAEAAVQGFMMAAADSNPAKMAEHWGSAKGPAGKTKEPADYERRIAIMQAYLRNSSHRILSNTADTRSADRRNLMVEVKRDQCEKIVPISVVRTSAGTWVINSIELTALGTPGRPCEEAGASPAPAPGS